MKFFRTIPILAFLALTFLRASSAHATFVYTSGTVPYVVSCDTTGSYTVDAGPDQNVFSPQTSAYLSATTTACAPTVQWTLVVTPFPGVTIISPTSLATPVTGLQPAPSPYIFNLVVTDLNGAQKTDAVYVNVKGSGYNLTATYTSPNSAVPGNVTLTGSAINNGSLATSIPFTSYFEIQGDPILSWTSPAISLNAGATQTVTAVRSMPVGTYQVQLCADGANVDPSELSEGDNCSGWNTLAVSAPTTTYTITATAGAHGTIDPPGVTTVTGGSTESYAITPDMGYDIASVTVDNVNIGTPTAHDFPNISANHTIKASFKVSTALPSGSTQCSDGVDNDGDKKIDLNDPGCSSPTDDNEADPKPIFIEF